MNIEIIDLPYNVNEDNTCFITIDRESFKEVDAESLKKIKEKISKGFKFKLAVLNFNRDDDCDILVEAIKDFGIEEAVIVLGTGCNNIKYFKKLIVEKLPDFTATALTDGKNVFLAKDIYPESFTIEEEVQQEIKYCSLIKRLSGATAGNSENLKFEDIKGVETGKNTGSKALKPGQKKKKRPKDIYPESFTIEEEVQQANDLLKKAVEEGADQKTIEEKLKNVEDFIDKATEKTRALLDSFKKKKDLGQQFEKPEKEKEKEKEKKKKKEKEKKKKKEKGDEIPNPATIACFPQYPQKTLDIEEGFNRRF